MIFEPAHFGLFYTRERLSITQTLEDHPIAAKALEALKAMPLESDTPEQVMVSAHRYQFLQDEAVVETAIEQLSTVKIDGDGVTTCAEWIALAQCFELLRDHPNFTEEDRTQWVSQFEQSITQILSAADVPLLTRLWHIALGLAASVVLEDREQFTTNVKHFQSIVSDHIHPEGYLIGIADDEQPNSFERQFSGVCALVLAAECATQAGTDLWSYHDRGVSVATAASYLLYYLFLPNLWRWGDAPDETSIYKLIQEQGAFIEIAHKRVQPQGAAELLEEHRPLFAKLAGGFTTLTHAQEPKKKRRWFG